MTSWDAIVVGRGIIGTLSALRLQAAGHRVLLLGASAAGRGAATLASAAVVRTLCDEPRLAAESLDWYRRWPGTGRLGQPVFVRCGVVLVVPIAAEPAVHLARALLGAGSVLPGEPAALPTPYDAGAGQVWLEPGSGCADPAPLLRSVTRAFRASGGTCRVTNVRRLARTGGRWEVSTAGGPVRARIVLVAAGAATAALMPDPVTRRAVTRMPASLGHFGWHARRPGGCPFPSIVDLEHGLLLRPGRGGLIATLRSPARGRVFLAELRRVAGSRLPALGVIDPTLVAESEVDLTPDRRPYVGPAGEGLFVAYGLNGGGLKIAPALTRHIATMIGTGTVPAEIRHMDAVRSPAAADHPLSALA